MPDQKNLQWYRYVTDKGVNCGIQADKIWGDNAASGLTTANSADFPFGPQSTQHHTRKAIYRDPLTFRTVIHPVGTTAALASAPATISVSIVGSATPVVYNLAGLRGEKLRIPGPSHGLTDHP